MLSPIEVTPAPRSEGRILGVAVLAYRPNIPAGALFASIEDLYVRPEARRQGVGTALLTAANERCATRKISYVEVQVEGEPAESFYKTLGYELGAGVRVLSRSLALPEA
jgi:GNAT superfamily N-acetyltransferase